jgi:hypothetical protein
VYTGVEYRVVLMYSPYWRTWRTSEFTSLGESRSIAVSARRRLFQKLSEANGRSRDDLDPSPPAGATVVRTAASAIASTRSRQRMGRGAILVPGPVG